MADGSQKYEREIAEILERMERDEPRTERVKRETRQKAERRWQDVRRGTSNLRGVGQGFGQAAGWTWIALTVAAGVLGLILKSISPFLGLLAAIVMVILFFSPLLGAFSGPPSPAPSNMWRGKVVDFPARGNFFANLRYRWRRFRGGRYR